MKSALLFASLLLFAGCNRRDADLRQHIAGTWTRDSFEMTLSAEGSFVSRWTHSTSSLIYQGTWTVRDGGVVSTITNCIAHGTTNFEAVGSVERWAIVRLDRSDLVWSNEGQTISLKRK